MSTTLLPTYETSTERLLAAADLIEANPSRHDQTIWMTETARDAVDDLVEFTPLNANEVMSRCGTAACAAGWGTALTPKVELVGCRNFIDAGRAAFGLQGDLDVLLFDGSAGLFDVDRNAIPERKA